MRKITCVTIAYNAEKTLGRTISSIIHQTMLDFEYIIIDHGSTDGTRDIMRSYMREDIRIKCVYMDKNTGSENLPNLVLETLRGASGEWFAVLDADDEYKVDFFEKMLAFAKDNQLDFACCGSEFVDTETNSTYHYRKAEQTLLLTSANEIDIYFSQYYQFLRVWWGKLISNRLFMKCDFSKTKGLVISDTVIAIILLQNSRKVGILNECLHRYYFSTASASHVYFSFLPAFHISIYDQARDFLISKTGGVSPQNDEFLLVVHMNALIDTLSVLLNADLPESEKIDALRDMFLCEHARTLAAREDFGALFGDAPGQTRRRGELFSAAANWLLTREEVADEQIEGYCELGEFLCAACENADGWIFFKKLLAQFLVENNRTDEAKPRLDELRELLPDDDEIKAMIGDTGATLAGPSGTDGPCGDAGVAARLRDEKNFVAGAERQDFIIVGANSWGGVLYQKLVAERGSAAGVSLCDLTGKFAGKIVNVGSAGSVRVMPFEKLRALPVRERRRTAVVLAEQQLYWKSALAALKESGIGDVYVLPTHAYTDASVRATDLLYKVPAERPILTYYEYHVTDHCNLKCKHCGHFSNLVAAPVYCDLEQYKKDVKRLGELFWNVARLRLMGGEPLLNPELPEFIRVTRETFPVADLHVVTNGLLIPTADGTVFEAMREHRVTFHISGYAPTHKMRGKIEARCAAEGVVFGIDPLIKEFTTTQLPLLEMPPSDDWEAAKRVHKQCGFNAMCHFLRDGYLYYCGGALLPILYDRFGLDITENHLYMNIDKMRFDLSDMTLDGWEMNEILDNAHEECRYCVNTKPRAATIPWETCPSENARLEDYL